MSPVTKEGPSKKLLVLSGSFLVLKGTFGTELRKVILWVSSTSRLPGPEVPKVGPVKYIKTSVNPSTLLRGLVRVVKIRVVGTPGVEKGV